MKQVEACTRFAVDPGKAVGMMTVDPGCSLDSPHTSSPWWG